MIDKSTSREIDRENLLTAEKVIADAGINSAMLLEITERSLHTDARKLKKKSEGTPTGEVPSGTQLRNLSDTLSEASISVGELRKKIESDVIQIASST